MFLLCKVPFQTLANVECSGSSPLEAGIRLALSCLLYGGGHFAAFKHNLKVAARLIIISDGWPSTSAEIGGPEIDRFSKESFYDGTIERLQSLIKAIGKINPIVCIPVGPDPNVEFLKGLVQLCRRGRLLNHKDSCQCGRLALHMRMITHVLDIKPNGQITRQDIGRIARFSSVGTEFTEHDLEDVFNIIDSLYAYKLPTEEDLNPDEDVFTERYSNLPKIGTRVRRVPHWTYKNQDSNGPGTVIGHSENFGWVIVEWDNGDRLSYQYGFDGMVEKYDIATSEEPRILENELIAVGCLVT
ncbi:uncharacterized protein LOC134257814, partial [Saccostrea cucullata]|uniref:uncharacterized protein LOC134257814 n=1 Tax=Saccostrea cuccullata TaxID=36930 RepID=UPI002ED3C333